MLPNFQVPTLASRRYFCHQCQNNFMKQISPEPETNESIECTICKSDFCEEAPSEPEPSFLPPERSSLPLFMRSPFSIRRILSNGHLILEIRNFSNLRLPQQLMPFAAGSDHNFDNIVTQLMENDPNKYGSPPASKSSVESLESIQIDKQCIEKMPMNDCSICKDEFSEGDELRKMPCNHLFHNACLVKWLNQRNSCPVCRFELETEDPDYETRKKQTR